MGEAFLYGNGSSGPNNGDVSTSIVNGVLLKGYTDGGVIANLVPENIVENINIAGIMGTSKRGAFGTATSKQIISDTKFASYSGTGSTRYYHVIEINNLGWIPKYIFAIGFSQSEIPITQSELGLFVNIAFHIDSGFFKDTSTGTVFQQAYFASNANSNFKYGLLGILQRNSYHEFNAPNIVYQTALYPETSYPGVPFSANKACLVVGDKNQPAQKYTWFAVG